MSACPAQAAKWSGLEPLASALLQEASYVSNSSTMSLEDKNSKAPIFVLLYVAVEVVKSNNGVESLVGGGGTR